MDNEWPFDQPSNVAAITTANVLDRGLPILRVVHYSDDHSWAFLCGLNVDESEGRVVGMGTALKLDGTLVEVADLPPGWVAWRERKGAAWQRARDI